MSATTNNDIFIFVTEGCESCKIAENLTRKAIEESNISINLEVVNPFKQEHSVAKLLIDDFPTTMFIKRGKVIETVIGTNSVKELVNIINECFKDY